MQPVRPGAEPKFLGKSSSMICVSIGRGRHKHAIAELKHLAGLGVKLVEVRLDYINGEVNLKRLFDNRPCPVVVTCRRRRDGGQWKGSEEDRLMLIRQAIAMGVDYIDLEEDIAASIPRFGKTKRIVSYHDFRETPEDLQGLHARMAAMQADIVKIACMANEPHDNLRVLRLVRDAKVPTVGLCMGDMGIPTRVLGGKFGAPFTYAAFHQERVLAPGQLGYGQMVDVYRYDQIDRHTAVFGVAADPIAHSHSPRIHNAGLKALGLNAVYLPFRISREHLQTFFRDAAELGISGLSITIPHKEAAVPLLDICDADVANIGACNTIVWKDGAIHGFNTDYQAAMASLQKACDGEDLQGQTALVLGAGGAAKAIAFGLNQRKARVVITGRTLDRSEELANRLGCRSVEWELRHAVKPNILVNCTPIGMHPNVDESPFEKSHLHPQMRVFDTVYNPENTLFIKEAKLRGCKVITGVEMFIGQATRQFELFTGRPAPVEIMRETLKQATSAAQINRPAPVDPDDQEGSEEGERESKSA